MGCATDNQMAVLESPAFGDKGDEETFLFSGGGPDTEVQFVDVVTANNTLLTGGPKGPQMERYIVEIPAEY